MPRLLTILVLLLANKFLVAADALDPMRQYYTERLQAADTTRDQNLKKLETSYVNALQRHMDKVKASGKLELVLPVHNEITAIESATSPLPALPDNADNELQKLRKKFMDARVEILRTHATSLSGLADKMDEVLKEEESSLTRAGKIADALAAKTLRESLAKDPALADARTLLLDNGAPPILLGEWQPLLAQNMNILSQGQQPTGRLSDIIKKEGPAAIGLMAGGTKLDPETVLVSPSPCRFRFQTAQSITRLRGKVSLTHTGGGVICRIFVGDVKVMEKPLHLNERHVDIGIDFSPTKVIELEIDEQGHPGNDWVIWTNMEVR